MLAVLDHAHFLAHAPFAHHASGNGSGAFDVAPGAVGDVAKDNFLRHATAHGHGEAGQQFLFAIGVFVFLGQPHGGTERWPARNDGDLVQRLGVREQHEQQCVPRFVVGGVFLFFFAQRKAAAFLAPANLVARFFQFGEGDGL